MAATGLAVYQPILPGMYGNGRKISGARKDRADFESEVDDLLLVIDLLRENNGVDGSRIAIVGEGYGGALALVLAGSRPGTVQGVVAIDPIVDWDIALDDATGAERLYDAFIHLPGVDEAALVRGANGVGGHRDVIWRREAGFPALT